ncbi:MAG TPA: DNA starvation/stationary phase protection protein [Terracidiphilus sp.]|jgi:starvation-inducible DNA-binding protein
MPTPEAKTAPSPAGFSPDYIKDGSKALNALLADVFALYIKTKNFHWHMEGPHFRDYHLLLDEQSDQIFAMGDDIAERVRKIGGTTIRSIGHIAKLQTIADDDRQHVSAKEMLSELLDDNRSMLEVMREAHHIADDSGDAATASLLENWLDETERRAWFLFETLK